ncbi:carboxylesterase type B [Nocardia tenerifensis]|uniref:Carboxylic ester hydrolase n=1 Tax=Nocardia tenerifensis TaxID=228006 RepID=A0A318JYJ8_9NOCA|nr:carboxylesterase family protein [Nocardia tenerifensis]PXX59249.1 carboxylesterase type B [Nocardia tenerifensis]
MTSESNQSAVVGTATGKVRGVIEGAVTVFRGIPYARAVRFGVPEAVAPWEDVRDAVESGPAAPQLASRLDQVMGSFAVPQAEDCLSLNVWAPPGDDHPVLVFLHGGGFSSGTGRLGWYDGAELAALGDVVVVTVNYRLGALGFLRLPGVSDGNLGLLDQIAALTWIRDNIAAFGGDPARVTVSGQSAGAISIVAMLSGDRADGLFQRAILQSAPLGMLPDAPDQAEETGAKFLRELGIEAEQLGDVPVEAMLAAQRAVAMGAEGRVVPPFQLVADGAVVAADPVGAVSARTDGMPMLMGTTRDEAAAFFSHDWDAVAAITEQLFAAPTRRLSEARNPAGAPAWLFRFDWHPQDSPLRACHCLELPFLLGNEHAWQDAPMLRGERPQQLVDEMRRAWLNFVIDGDPGWERGGIRYFTDSESR